MKVLLIIFIFILAGCDKSYTSSDVFSNLIATPNNIYADGQSKVYISVKLNANSSLDRRVISFSTSSGTFDGSGKSVVYDTAEYINGDLICSAYLKAPLIPGQITISAEPKFDSPIGEYKLTTFINAEVSKPSYLSLKSNSIGLLPNGGSQVFISALLKNLNNQFVSKGFRVVFKDSLLSGGPANGIFSSTYATINDSSLASVYYAAGNLPVGSKILISAQALDTLGIGSSIKDYITLSIY